LLAFVGLADDSAGGVPAAAAVKSTNFVRQLRREIVFSAGMGAVFSGTLLKVNAKRPNEL
jgi:hypothetical protein